MKKAFLLAGIIAIAVIIGFMFLACGDPSGGSGQYSGLDVLGNSYKLSVGSDARSAMKGDNFKINVKTRDGSTKNITGTVTGISTDGTLTLKQSGTNVEFSARVDGTNNLDSVASLNPAHTGFIPRTFDTIFLRANRWENNTVGGYGPTRGEQYGSGYSVLVKDFPTNVSKVVDSTNRYTVTITGTSDVALTDVDFELQGLTASNEWVFFGSANIDSIPANSPFTRTANVRIFGEHNFMSYKEIIMQVTNVINFFADDHPEDNVDNGTIPDDIPNGFIMAAISDFSIKFVDTQRVPVGGNLGDYTYGFKEDGLSVEYRTAVWNLSMANMTNAKKPGAKLEITVGVNDIIPSGTVLDFIWQDPVRGLWWQPSTIITTDEHNNWAFVEGTGVTYNDTSKKITINLPEAINDDRFADSTELNFIIACWWYKDAAQNNIDAIKILTANIN